MKMKLSDYVANMLVEHGVRDVFMVTGGGAMHLNHSFGTHKRMRCTFNHHEQACAMAAEAYYRLTNRLPVVNVTSGPGGTNAITGVYGAFVDSVAMLVLSGQVKYETTVRSTGLKLRQYGDQELDIEELVRPVTKYCVMVTEPESIRYHLEKALYIARSAVRALAGWTSHSTCRAPRLRLTTSRASIRLNWLMRSHGKNRSRRSGAEDSRRGS